MSATTPSKTIKVFLASSDELAEERVRFGDFIRQLDDMYEIRGYRIKLYKWEDLPSGDDGRPKQDEYNDKVRECDMFVGLFHTKAGKFTLEEYDTAKNTQKASGKPTLYVFCREVKDGEQEEQSLKEFKAKLLQDIRHYWNKYSSSDSLQLQFVLQLLKVENRHWGDLKIENGQVRFGEMEIAQMGNLPFAAANKDYQRMSQRMREIPALVEKARLRVEKYPDDDDLRDDLQKLIEERNQLQEEFGQHQKYLLDTAMRIVQLQGEQISENRKRAQEAFEQGDVQKANIILDEAERNGDSLFDEYERNESLQAQRREIIHQTIDDLIFQISTVMADIGRPINERVNKAIELYRKAEYRASVTDYDKDKYALLLFNFAGFVFGFDLYQEAADLYGKLIGLYSDNPPHSLENPNCATAYNGLGLSFFRQGKLSEAYDYLNTAGVIREHVLGQNHPDTASSYSNLGNILYMQGDYPAALNLCEKALSIYEHTLGWRHPDAASVMHNMGLVFWSMKNDSQALQFYETALRIRENALAPNHPEIATSYKCIGKLFYSQGEYAKAAESFLKALTISEEKLGTEHKETVTLYNALGNTYVNLEDYPKALVFFLKALPTMEKRLGSEHPNVAVYCCNIGELYTELKDYTSALEYYSKALAIRERALGVEHPDTQKAKERVSAIQAAIS